MGYIRQYDSGVNWENTPSHSTPLNQTNLNQMDDAIENIDAEAYRAFRELEREFQEAMAGHIDISDIRMAFGVIGSDTTAQTSTSPALTMTLDVNFDATDKPALMFRKGVAQTYNWTTGQNITLNVNEMGAYPIYRGNTQVTTDDFDFGSDVYVVCLVRISNAYRWQLFEISASQISGIVPITNGGTGASDAAGARTNLGLGTLATKSQASLTTDVSGILPTANGGTGNADGYIRTGAVSGETIGQRTTIEGYQNHGSGQDSHVEGYDCTASAANTHAEGWTTVASGSYAHSEGKSTTASGTACHAEGNGTTATGQSAHAEGHNTTANSGTGGYGAHAEGYGSNATNLSAHAEGRETNATGQYSHSEGVFSTASGNWSHAQNYSTTAGGLSAHSEGYGTSASGNYSHAQGYGTVAGYQSQTVMGEYNDNKSTTLLEIGNGAENARSNALEVYANGNVVAAGTITDGNGNSIGDVAGTVPIAKGGTGNTVGYIQTGIASGSTAGRRATIEGLDNSVTGNESHAEGYANVVTGDNSHAEGQNNTVSGGQAHVAGKFNTAGYTAQTVVGQYNSNKSGTLFEVGNGTTTSARSNAFEVYSDGSISTNNGTTKIRFGVDGNGNYGYIKDGADTVTPFKNPTGSKNITITSNGSTTENVEDYASAYITVDVPTPTHTGTYVPAPNTAQNDMGASHTYRYVNTSGMVIPNGTLSGGTYTTNGSKTITGLNNYAAVSFTVAVNAQPTGHIYGVTWSGGTSSSMTRTDDAASFSSPSPYYSGLSNPHSVFDSIMPWAGVRRCNVSAVGELVEIPKFWYKWTKSGNSLQLQIADYAATGFYVSPAHADRGDGVGERDYVYVGRYHCASDYKSKSGYTAKVSTTRATFRSGIHNLSSYAWQNDYAMRITISMLYLVEYANWDSQGMIGYGSGNNSSLSNLGYTDSMPYHTGTTKSNKTTYGDGTQYRYIEGLWDEVYDLIDGIVFSGSSVYQHKNPSNFSDSKTNATYTGTRCTTSGCISVFTPSSASGFEWSIFPTSVYTSSSSYYVRDNYNYDSNGTVLFMGGDFHTGYSAFGLFCMYVNSTSSVSGGNIGSRLMYLPSSRVTS